MYQSIPSLTISRATPGDSHNLVAPGVGFRSSVLPGGLPGCQPPGVLNLSKSSIILKKSAIFPLSLEQRDSFHMFICARSEQCDLGPIYTITNTQRIRIYPGKLKFILVKISSDPGCLHQVANNAREKQTLFTFLTTANLSGLPCSRVQIFRIQIYSVML